MQRELAEVCNRKRKLRFGKIASIARYSSRGSQVTLNNGDELVLRGSNDVDEDNRGIIISDDNLGQVIVSWDDFDRLEFKDAPAKAVTYDAFDGGRLMSGKVITEDGDSFEGNIRWDNDEEYTWEILDGKYRDINFDIEFSKRFGKIASIARYSSRGSQVTLNNGDELVLRGSNDVDEDNRGIIISDDNLGQVIVSWDDFDRLEFKDAPAKAVTYDAFDGGRLMSGKVITEDGDSFEGNIRWDNDEEYTWEILDGKYRDINFDIEFSKIKQIEKRSKRSSIVTLFDGRSFRLSPHRRRHQGNRNRR